MSHVRRISTYSVEDCVIALNGLRDMRRKGEVSDEDFERLLNRILDRYIVARLEEATHPQPDSPST